MLPNDYYIAPLAVPWVKSFLAAQDFPVKVFAKIPQIVEDNIHPATSRWGDKEFLVVERTGGGQLSPATELVTLMVDSWAVYEGNAEQNAQIFVHEMTRGLNTVHHGSYMTNFEVIGGPVSLPHPDFDVPRYRVNVKFGLHKTRLPRYTPPR